MKYKSKIIPLILHNESHQAIFALSVVSIKHKTERVLQKRTEKSRKEVSSLRNLQLFLVIFAKILDPDQTQIFVRLEYEKRLQKRRKANIYGSSLGKMKQITDLTA